MIACIAHLMAVPGTPASGERSTAKMDAVSSFGMGDALLLLMWLRICVTRVLFIVYVESFVCHHYFIWNKARLRSDHAKP